MRSSGPGDGAHRHAGTPGSKAPCSAAARSPPGPAYGVRELVDVRAADGDATSRLRRAGADVTRRPAEQGGLSRQMRAPPREAPAAARGPTASGPGPVPEAAAADDVPA
ncbi:MAG: hypothetical protein M3Q27_16560, partial [Actinomycetota bacterium]|nr:hypothetical protein [Actinomycetota bacterium]